MPWVTPSSVSTGDTLQASEWNQSVVLNSLMGQPVFTNEAARDAAISSPSEGQMCYLTAPTVPAATGGSTAVPTGIVTIYNGSAWVCVTPVSALTTNQGNASTGYTTTLTGTPGTNPSVTLSTGTTALVSIRVRSLIGSTGSALMSVAVSGATTLAASDEWAIEMSSTAWWQMSNVFVLTGLTAGSNTFTLQYKGPGAGAAWQNRGIAVQGIA